jgi:stealth protein CR2/Stealth-like protein
VSEDQSPAEADAARAASPREGAKRVVVQGNAERSPAVELYRRLLPESARAAVADRVSPQVRNKIVTGIAGAVPRGTAEARRRLFDLRHADLIAAADRVLVTQGAQLKVATVEREPRPLSTRRANLDRVCAALREAGVDFFCVRGLSDRAASVAVRASERPRVVKALEQACRTTPGYVSVMVKDEQTPAGSAPGYEQNTWRRLGTAGVLRVTWFVTDPGKTMVLGHDYGCDVEFWSAEDDLLVAPRRNRVTEAVPLTASTIEAPGALFSRLYAHGDARAGAYPTRPEFTVPLADDVTFPVDAVYTWVDGDDPAWRERRDGALSGIGGHANLNEQAANAARYLSRDELRYSLRSIEMYAPWIRDIYLVTDRQAPAWLDTDHPRIKVVDHRDIFTDPTALPTFNSHAIESQLHHIDGLAEHFLYLNDDVFLGRPVLPEVFFHANGLAKFFVSPAQLAMGTPSLADPPVVSAGKNNRAIIEKLFGHVITQKIKHAPHPLRRSVLAEIEDTFPELHTGTARHRFRSPEDIAITSSLHHWYAYYSGRSVPDDIRYAYADLAARHTPRRLNRFLGERALDAFCLNDTESDESSTAAQMKLLDWFLRAYFPVAAPWEKDRG